MHTATWAGASAMMTHDLHGSMAIWVAMSEGYARTLPCDLAGARQCEM